MGAILIRNAYENNLKHINLEIPLNAFTCVTGCSGSGKSSLVFDTIYAESQRRLFDGMTGNLYGQKLMNKPKVGQIENLHPALNISQSYYNVNPRSTIGTVTEISYYLRSLFSVLNRGVTENMFSANNPKAYCPNCYGLGTETIVSESLLIPDRSKTLRDGAILYFKGTPDSKEQKTLQAICDYYNIDIDKRVSELSKRELDLLLYADEGILQKISYKEGRRKKQHNIFLRGAIADIQAKVGQVDCSNSSTMYSKYMEDVPCHVCKGTKLRETILEYRINKLNYSEVENMELSTLEAWLENFDYNGLALNESKIVSEIVESILSRVRFLIQLNVGYLCLNRTIPSLSGGERQRIRIATQLNCSLRGLIYILDEPCKGLHFRDIASVVKATRDLVNNDNTVIAIEHNRQYISAAENIIELGPVGGPNGGYLISERERGKTERQITVPCRLIKRAEAYLELKNVTFRNIASQNVRIPLGGITCITGVSGSGKTSLAHVISTCVERRTNYHCESFTGGNIIKRVVEVNQSPIGKNPRSTIVSYLNIYDDIRNLFAQTDAAKKMKLNASTFSMNVKGGRCECCQGTGFQKIELNYLPNFFITCPECEGKRFHPAILSVQYRGKTIQEVLDTPIDDIIYLFEGQKKVYLALDSMVKLGLGYLKLGQMSMNLSGGEAQRIKLARALSISSSGKNLYIFDEPTSGLNHVDINRFAENIVALINNQETIVVIEHNIEFVSKMSDYIIDFGIFGGDKGGRIVAQGLPADVFENPESSIYHLNA